MESLKRDTRIFFVGLLTVVLCLGLMVLPGCSQNTDTNTDPSTTDAGDQNAPTAYTFTDDLGNEVAVDNPERVVACMGSFANTWELAGGTLVGATEDAFTSYTIASTDVEKVGDFTAPNLEAIIALDPDFVIMTGASTGKDGAASQTDLKATLDASGIPVAYFNVTTFDDYLRMLRTCCDITGRDDLFEQNGADVSKQIAEIKGKIPGGEVPTVLLMTTYSGGTRVQNSSTMTGTMLSELGVVNLADQNTGLLKDFSLESVIELNPDYILVVPMGNSTEAALKNLTEATEANPAWSTLDAVKNGRFITLDMEHFLAKPNERWAESYQVLYDALYA